MIIAFTDAADETKLLAAALAELTRAGDVVLLAGDLGPGKTAFAQGFGRALGIDEPITSPTYTLVSQYSGRLELKGEKLLKRKVFRLAGQMQPIEGIERRRLARACLDRGDEHRGDPTGGNPTMPELTALAQAKLAFVEEVFTLCARYHVSAFASIRGIST